MEAAIKTVVPPSDRPQEPETGFDLEAHTTQDPQARRQTMAALKVQLEEEVRRSTLVSSSGDSDTDDAQITKRHNQLQRIERKGYDAADVLKNRMGIAIVRPPKAPESSSKVELAVDVPMEIKGPLELCSYCYLPFEPIDKVYSPVKTNYLHNMKGFCAACIDRANAADQDAKTIRETKAENLKRKSQVVLEVRGHAKRVMDQVFKFQKAFSADTELSMDTLDEAAQLHEALEDFSYKFRQNIRMLEEAWGKTTSVFDEYNKANM